MKKPEYKYELDLETSLQEVINDTTLLRPEKAISIINNKHSQYRFIDLRNPAEFTKGHLESAINIPFKDLLSQEYESILNQEEFVNVLYAETELEAKEAKLLLRQIGYINNIVMLGGYQFVTNFIMDGYKTKSGLYPDDKTAYDYAKIVKNTKGYAKIDQEIKPKKVLVKTRKVETQVAGGC